MTFPTANDFRSWGTNFGGSAPSLPNLPASVPQQSSWTWLPEFNAQGRMTSTGVLAPALQGFNSLAGLYFGLDDRREARRARRQEQSNFEAQLARVDQDYANQLEQQYRRQNATQGPISAEALQAYIDERTV